MGLDNGIIIKRVKKDKVKEIPNFVKYDVLNSYTYDFFSDMPKIDKDYVDIDIAYFRKCWGIRQAIIDKFHLDQNDASFTLDKEDISALIRVLISFLSKEYWDEYADSIWEFEEYAENIIQVIINLKWLETYIDSHNDVVKFYDSY